MSSGYSAIFRQSLFVNITDWTSFFSFYLTNALSYVVGFFVPMSEKLHNVADHQIKRHFADSSAGICCLSFLVGKVVEPDLLHQRGILCFRAYLKNRALNIASFQYAVFAVFIGITGINEKVFVNFSEAAGFDLGQQLLFVLIAKLLDYANFTLTNMLCQSKYEITPTYVGNCHLKQYPRVRRSLCMIAAHIISDVYLGMVFAMRGGIYYLDARGSGSANLT